MTSSQQAEWESNIYILTTTRIFGVFGLAYLFKSCYQFYHSLRASNDDSAARNRIIDPDQHGIGLELGLNGFLSGDASALGLEDITEIGEMVQVRRPLPAYYPGGLDTRGLGLVDSAE